MRVLVVTTWFPTATSPAMGIFVARDVAAIASRHDVRVLHLVAPRLVSEADRPGEGFHPLSDAHLAGDRTDGAGSTGRGAQGDGARDVLVERWPMDPARPDHLWRAARRIAELSEHADVVHSMAVSALAPTWRGRRDGIPWVHTEHWSGLLAPDTLTLGLRAARTGILKLLQAPDVVAVVSQGLAQGVRQVRSKPVVVIPNIVDPPAEAHPRRAPETALSERDELRLIGIGGLIDRKDPLRAVQTASALRQRGIPAHLTWVGDGPLRTTVRVAAAQRGVPLRLVGNQVPARVWDELAAADLLLLPTRAETFCVVAAEALAAGRPVVVGDVIGPRDFVEPPTGVLVAPGASPVAWADAVEEVWRSAGAVAAVEIAAPIRERFSAEAHADRVDQVYRSLMPANQLVDADHVPTGSEQSSPARSGQARPVVDLVIAVHSTERQLARALASLLEDPAQVPLRVSVVAHNIDPQAIIASLETEHRHLVHDERVRFLEVQDGLRSPSGPFNHGIERAEAPWVSIMGSDDHLEPGALAGWLAAAAGEDPDQPVVIIPPLVLDGARVPTPPVRPGRTHDLDFVADRLSYRSAPLGLLSRGALRLPGARLLPGAPVGGDVPMSTVLWTGARVHLAAEAPAYVIGSDASDRVTYEPRPIDEQLSSVQALWEHRGLSSLGSDERRAIATKILRIHIFGAVLTRPDPQWWTPMERASLARITADLLSREPRAADPLSRADHDLLGAVLDPQIPAEALIALARARRRHGSLGTLVNRPAMLLHPEGPLRFMASSWWARRSSRSS